MCWFIHETENKNEEKNNTEDESLIKRLVDMVEKLNKQVILMEENEKVLHTKQIHEKNEG